MKELFFTITESWKMSPGLTSLAVVAWLLVISVLVLAFMAFFAGSITWVERRVAARMQSRVGPNRVGPQGYLQWLADGLKCFLKEDVIPAAADRPLFRFAPYIVFAGVFGAFAALPFGYGLVATNIDVGIFYISAVTTLVVVGILMAGWSSNNKWSLLGGVRSTAQIVSYEIPSGLAILSIVALAGTLNMQEIIRQQGGWPWQWFIFNNPFSLAASVVFLASITAEGNRAPFDLPEAESELVAGYITEYSGMRFVFYLFAEWANLWVMSAIITTLFLGGWQIPGISDLGVFLAQQSSFAMKALWILLSVAVFFAKTLTLVFVAIWTRWTLPRMRVDQVMTVCWQYLIPIGFVCLMGSALFSLVPGEGLWAWFHLGLKLALTTLGGVFVLLLMRRAVYNHRNLREDLFLRMRI